MTRTRRTTLLATLALLPLPAFAQPEGRGGGNNRGGGGGGSGRGGGPPHGRGGGRDDRGGGPSGRGNGQGNRGGPPASFATSDRTIVRSWVGSNPGFVTQPLPPGMRNRLAQGKPLPPGIARRAAPPGLIGLLPARPGYEYVVVGTSLVLVSIATGVVASILADALLR